MRLLSILLPAYNEEANVARIYEAITEEAKKFTYDYEILFINDGSKDNTLEEIHKIEHDHHVKYVSFSRNFGKEAGIFAGLQNAKGDAVIIMDSDLQHPPELIHELVKGHEAGYHQVIACRDRKGEPTLKKGIKNMFYKMMNRLSSVELQNGAGDFRLLSRKAVDALLSLSERNRFSKGLFEWIGLSKTEIYYENVERQFGETKWSFGMLFSYALDGLLSFNTKPLRFCMYLGVTLLAGGVAYIIAMLLLILLRGIDVPGYFTIISSVILLGGVQLFSLGVIGEYIGKIYNEVKQRPIYIVGETNIDNVENK